MNGKSGLLLFLAVACGLGAMFGVRKLLSKDSAVEMASVVVAVRDIKAEEVLKEDMVKVAQVPKSAAPAGAASSFQDVEGRWVKIALLADEPIVEGKLAAKNAPPGLPSRIPKGMRAVAIEVSEKTGVSGFVLPDHRVDVIQARNPNGGPAPAADAETILEDVLVLAAGQATTRPEDKSIQVHTVTLALSPEDVDKVVAAGAKGPLALSLRGVNDHEPVKKKSEPARQDTRPILVAARDLRPDERISPEKVRVKQVPAGEAPEQAVASHDDLKGLRPSMPIFAGEPIVRPKLGPEGQPPIRPAAPRLGEGMRAITLPVDEHSVVAGLISPGDRVDVLKSDEADSSMILQDVRVLKVAGARPADGGINGPPKGLPTRAEEEAPSGGKRAVTLEVHARDAAALASARSSGAITLALRDPGDRKRFTPARAVPARFESRQVVIYRGLAPGVVLPIRGRMIAPESREEERYEDGGGGLAASDPVPAVATTGGAR